jgi:hypothetical protein
MAADPPQQTIGVRLVWVDERNHAGAEFRFPQPGGEYSGKAQQRRGEVGEVEAGQVAAADEQNGSLAALDRVQREPDAIIEDDNGFRLGRVGRDRDGGAVEQGCGAHGLVPPFCGAGVLTGLGLSAPVGGPQDGGGSARPGGWSDA